jgi:3-phenylpropionate/trans-cinnamate dioxygenase ferredoxin component
MKDHIAQLSDFAAAKIIPVFWNNIEILLVKSPDNKIYAFQDKCSHSEVSLCDGDFDDLNLTITCSAHGSVFNCKSGEINQGPAKIALRTFPIQVIGDDIYILS